MADCARAKRAGVIRPLLMNQIVRKRQLAIGEKKLGSLATALLSKSTASERAFSEASTGP